MRVQSVGPRLKKSAVTDLLGAAIQDDDEAHTPFLEEACAWINAELAKEDAWRGRASVGGGFSRKTLGFARPAARFGRGEEGVLQRDPGGTARVARESREQDGLHKRRKEQLTGVVVVAHACRSRHVSLPPPSAR